MTTVLSLIIATAASLLIRSWCTMLAFGILHADLAKEVPAIGWARAVPVAIALTLLIDPPRITLNRQ